MLPQYQTAWYKTEGKVVENRERAKHDEHKEEKVGCQMCYHSVKQQGARVKNSEHDEHDEHEAQEAIDVVHRSAYPRSVPATTWTPRPRRLPALRGHFPTTARRRPGHRGESGGRWSNMFDKKYEKREKNSISLCVL